MRALVCIYFFTLSMLLPYPLYSAEIKQENPDVQALIKPKSSSWLDEAELCESCHKRVYSEWSESMHASSTPASNKIVNSLYTYLSSKGYDTKKCNKCHAPVRSIFSNEEGKDKAIFNEGVTCIVCHSVYGKASEDESALGIDYFMINLKRGYTGPVVTKNMSYHKTTAVPLFRSTDYCRGCHREGEATYSQEAGKGTLCQYCHMPSKQKQKAAILGKERKKVYRHLFEGGHNEIILEMAASLTGNAKREKSHLLLTVDIENFALHSLPTGFPMREVYVKIEGLDNNHKTVWSNFKENPALEDPQAHFSLQYSGKESFKAHYADSVKPIEDRRIGPGKTRRISYNIDDKLISIFVVQLYYRLIPKEALKELGLDEINAPETLMLEELIYVK